MQAPVLGQDFHEWERLMQAQVLEQGERRMQAQVLEQDLPTVVY